MIGRPTRFPFLPSEDAQIDATELAMKLYRRRLGFASDGLSSAEIARQIIDAMAWRDEACLFGRVLDICPADVRQEVLAFVASLAASGYDRFIIGGGSGPTTEEEMQQLRVAVQASYREIAIAAGVDPRPAEPLGLRPDLRH
jgi:DNA-binding CsgD family transcriptional regulator